MSDGSKKVLVVEDNVVNQKVATLLLQQLGLSVDVVDSGRKAVQAVEKELYAMILMDCQMPEMDGFQTTVAIRKLEALRGSYTPIVAVTALSMVGDKERCIAAGMDDYISKPIDRQMLKIKLNHWLQKDIVMKNQELARKYAQPDLFVTSVDEPIDLAELRDYYGDNLQDVLNTFVEDTEVLIAEINHAILHCDNDHLAHLAHELKGSSASVGAKGTAKICLFLERAAGLKDWHDATESFTALSMAFARIKDFIRLQNSASHAEVILPRRE
ncbi:MAG: response regulator [Cyanobacteria bacterium SZAS-4]|nr:response regulator [Cyanobacteria bacterium SZAS-4]